MPSPSPEHAGLFIRDPYRFSDAMLIIPPVLVECLQCFDGRQTELDLRAALVRITNTLEIGEIAQNLAETLSTAGFLEDENFARMETERRREFTEQTVREPAHAGGAYPGQPDELRQTMSRYMAAEAGEPRSAPAEDRGGDGDPPRHQPAEAGLRDGPANDGDHRGFG